MHENICPVNKLSLLYESDGILLVAVIITNLNLLIFNKAALKKRTALSFLDLLYNFD